MEEELKYVQVEKASHTARIMLDSAVEEEQHDISQHYHIKLWREHDKA